MKFQMAQVEIIEENIRDIRLSFLTQSDIDLP